MTQVHVTTYEIVGDGLPLAIEHFAAIQASKAACWAKAEEFGAAGFRPGHYGIAIQSLFFKSARAPNGFRKVATHGDKIECRPIGNTKAGKEIARALNPEGLAPPSGDDLARKFGWNTGQWVTNGYSIFFPTAVSVDLPAARYFLRLPRQEGDGWAEPETLNPIPESVLMLAIAQHNELARQHNEAKAA